MDGYSVQIQMLVWNVKFQAQRVKVLCPTFHSISVLAHCSTQKSKCLKKSFGLLYDDHFDSHVYTKRREF